MEYRRLGNSGLKVSAISLGSWRTFGISVKDEATEACMVAAYESGINYFDGAEAYGAGAAEEAMGRVLQKTKWGRDTLVLSGKVTRFGDLPTQRGLSRKHLTDACHATMKRYGTDYLDLFFCHRPDPDTPAEEIVRTMDILMRQGKILYWGTSMFSPVQLAELISVADQLGMPRPLMEQSPYNMARRVRFENEVEPFCRSFGMGTTVYSPLDVGLLTGKFTEPHVVPGRSKNQEKKFNSAYVSVLNGLRPIAEELAATLAQLALAWLLKNPNVSTCLTGATRAEQVEDNVKAVEVADRIDHAMLKRINEVIVGFG